MARDAERGKQDARQRVKRGLSIVGGFWAKINNDWIFNLAGMLAYNILMSAFPILLVLLAVGGFILGPAGHGSQASLQAGIEKALPAGTGRALLTNATHNLNNSAGILLIVGVVVALVTGSGLFITMENAFGIIFRLRGRDPLHQRLMATGMLLLYVVLIPIILLASIIPSFIVHALPVGNSSPVTGFFIQAAGDIFSVLVACLFFGAVYVVVPNRPVRWGEVWKGTLVAAVLLVIYETLFPLYVAAFLHPNNYGSTAGFAVVILIFFYYLAFIMLLGAEVNSWIIGQRATAGSITAILHEVQAHNTTRGAAGPTAGMPQEDLASNEGAAAMRDTRHAIMHELEAHRHDEQPPKFAESGVEAPGYRIETEGERNAIMRQGDGLAQGQEAADRVVLDKAQAEQTINDAQTDQQPDSMSGRPR
ncbi:MAG: YihY/virulence factor BrkB family protein [Ktedonobacterales bacterium]